MSYVIFKGTVPQGNKKFATYEKARQQARKWIRKNDTFKAWYLVTSNPATYLDGGYTIRRTHG